MGDFRTLSPFRKDEINTLFEGLQAGEISWADVDTWVAELYGLGSHDLQVIADTLEFNLPFAYSKQAAQAVPPDDEQVRFREVLGNELAPWCERFGTRLVARTLPLPATSPWCGIELRVSPPDSERLNGEADWVGLLRAADDIAASEILFRDSDAGLLIGRLAQRRYWSETQARLLAQRIIWSHLDLLKGSAQA